MSVIGTTSILVRQSVSDKIYFASCAIHIKKDEPLGPWLSKQHLKERKGELNEHRRSPLNQLGNGILMIQRSSRQSLMMKSGKYTTVN